MTMLSYRDLEVINLELTTQVQEMDHQIRSGRQFNGDTLKHLADMKAAVARVRHAMQPSSPSLRVVA